ncbi:hypothetical protein [Acidovorax facilis]|uniref:hypothetical protein n=1 Tax=Acidovorax facilis TaxID=12917 RepID=UPI003D65B0AD
MYKKALPITFLLAATSLYAAEANFCEISGQDGCGLGAAVVNPDSTPVLVLRGHALSDSNKPAISGTMTVEHQESGNKVQIKLSKVFRPSLTASKLAGKSETSVAREKWMTGLEGAVYTSSLASGQYNIVALSLNYEGEGVKELKLDANSAGAFRIEAPISGTQGIALMSKQGDLLSELNVSKGLGAWRVAGYKAMRDGEYKLSVSLGNLTKTKSFSLQRPVRSLASSLPNVVDFPGAGVKLTSVDTMKGTGMQGRRELVNDSDKAFVINGTRVEPGQGASVDFTAGTAAALLSDDTPGTGVRKVKLFNTAPDGNNFEISLNRWRVEDRVAVTASKPSAAVKVEDVDVTVKLSGAGADSCSMLRTYSESDRLFEMDSVVCAIQWKDTAGIPPNRFSPAALQGPPLAVGPNQLQYVPGVIYTNPLTKRSAFYPSAEGAKSFSIEGTVPAPIKLAFTPYVSYNPYYAQMALPETTKLVKVSPEGGEQLVGNVGVTGAHKGIRTRVAVGQNSREFLSSFQSAAYAVTAGISESLGTKPVLVEAWYDRAPEHKVSLAFDVMGVPMGPRVFMDRELVSHTLSPSVVTGRLAESVGSRLEYAPEKHGKWEIAVVDAASGTPHGNRVGIDAQGQFSVDLGVLTPGQRRMKAIAYLIDANGAVSDFKTTTVQDFYLTTYDGRAPVFKVSAKTAAGAIPFPAQVSAAFEEPELYKVAETIQWSVSSDNGTTWAPMLDDKGRPYVGQSLNSRFSEPGTYLVRGFSRNKYSKQDFTSPPLQLLAYSGGSIVIDGPTAANVDTPVELKSVVTGFGSPVYKWALSFGSDAAAAIGAGSGQTFQFTPKAAQNYTVTLSVKDSTAPDEPRSWTSKVFGLKAVQPLTARASIDGPRVVETGKTYRYTAKINDVVSSSSTKNYVVRGAWLLPDGSRVEGMEIDLSIAPGQTAVNYLTWVDGRPEVTATSVFPISAWSYGWPDWKIDVTVNEKTVPATLRYNLAMVGRTASELRGEPLTVTWSLPENMRQLSGSGMNGTWEITQPGRYQALARVADSRGNITDVTTAEIEVLPAPKVGGAMTVVSPYGAAKYYAPGAYTVSYRIESLPRGDRFSTNELIVNGNKQGEFTGSSAIIKVESPGDYDIKVRTLTQLGNYGESSETIVMKPAPAPTCNVKSTGTTSGTTYTADCMVEAGNIASYDWRFSVDGTEQVVKSKSAYVRQAWYGKATDLKLTVTSTLGATAQLTQPAPVAVPPAGQ